MARLEVGGATAGRLSKEPRGKTRRLGRSILHGTFATPRTVRTCPQLVLLTQPRRSALNAGYVPQNPRAVGCGRDGGQADRLGQLLKHPAGLKAAVQRPGRRSQTFHLLGVAAVRRAAHAGAPSWRRSCPRDKRVEREMDTGELLPYSKCWSVAC